MVFFFQKASFIKNIFNTYLKKKPLYAKINLDIEFSSLAAFINVAQNVSINIEVNNTIQQINLLGLFNTRSIRLLFDEFVVTVVEPPRNFITRLEIATVVGVLRCGFLVEKEISLA